MIISNITVICLPKFKIPISEIEKTDEPLLQDSLANALWDTRKSNKLIPWTKNETVIFTCGNKKDNYKK